MFTRIRIAIGFAFLTALLTAIGVSAKGGFDFITIAGPDLKEALRITDPALSEDFFTFANFYEDKSKAPTDPGKGYEITRHYVQGMGDIIFDRLHYYPETGFVFYDGIENGDSEYDGEWYTANPDIKTVFEETLAVSPMDEIRSNASTSTLQVQTRPSVPVSQIIVLTIMSIAAILSLTYRLRRASGH
jgi:hypothetical protein